MKRTAISFLAILCLLSVSAQAQEAPAPRKMPRTPVSSELLEQQQHDASPSSHQVQGLAAIIDGEKLRVGNIDMRLFGIVPPQLAASFGPQARAALDSLAGGQNVTCQIRDRDRDGRLLATCHNTKDYDMAYELLKHGLAVTARGSLAGTELAAPYLAAEQAAQMQKIGLWSAPVEVAANVPAAAIKAEVAAEATSHAETTASIAAQTSETQQKIAADLMAAQSSQARLDDAAWTPSPSAGFFERYQLLISVILMLLTAAGIMGALWMQKRRDRLDEIRAIAAALRGELMAARSVCAGRMKSITNDEEETTAVWPRIRSTLYQAYVGRLGLLGAELARQISSVYGQSSDYAGLYSQNGASGSTTKKQALESLVKNMDAILPRLSRIEHSGMHAPVAPAYAPALRPEMPTYRTTQQILAPTPPTLPQQSGETTGGADTPPALAHPAHETAMPPQAQPQAQASSPALWEAVRGFINTTRNAIAAPTEPQPDDHHVSEYTEMIEADMVRYRYDSSSENLDISPQKKQG